MTAKIRLEKLEPLSLIDRVTLRSNTRKLRLFENKMPQKCKLFQIIAVTKKKQFYLQD